MKVDIHVFKVSLERQEDKEARSPSLDALTVHVSAPDAGAASYAAIASTETLGKGYVVTSVKRGVRLSASTVVGGKS